MYITYSGNTCPSFKKWGSSGSCPLRLSPRESHPLDDDCTIQNISVDAMTTRHWRVYIASIRRTNGRRRLALCIVPKQQQPATSWRRTQADALLDTQRSIDHRHRDQTVRYESIAVPNVGAIDFSSFRSAYIYLTEKATLPLHEAP